MKILRIKNVHIWILKCARWKRIELESLVQFITMTELIIRFLVIINTINRFALLQ